MQQAEAVQALARTRPYVDSTRIGIWGWSGGGSSTLQAMFRYPDVYQVGMSVAPVPDERLYDTIYQERYMGLPGPNAAKYDCASAINQADGAQGPPAPGARLGRRQRALPGQPSGWSTGSSC